MIDYSEFRYYFEFTLRFETFAPTASCLSKYTQAICSLIIGLHVGLTLTLTGLTLKG